MTARTFARPLDAVDSVTLHQDGAERVVRASKTVRVTDPYMPGHFPGLTLYPAIFLLETVRQAVGSALEEPADGWLEIEELRQLRVMRPMLVGDLLELTIVLTPDGDGLSARARCDVQDSPVAELTVRLVPGGRGAA